MRLGSNIERTYQIRYLDRTFSIKSAECLKINGILFQKDAVRMEQANIEAVCEKIDRQFIKWSKRNLSTLGKILIVKTFGISQIIFLMQSIVISTASFKKLNAYLYKFIWNRHYSAAKAPERIERAIVNRPLKLGGLGMLDIKALDDSLKLKALGRLLASKHPFLIMLKDKMSMDQFFNPKIETKIDGVAGRGIELLREDRHKMWENNPKHSNATFLKAVRETDIKLVVSEAGCRSIRFFMIWRRGARKAKDLSENDLVELRRHIDENKLCTIRKARALRLGGMTHDDCEAYYLRGGSKSLSKCTSKEIRTSRVNDEPIESYKIGMNLSKVAALSWCLKLTKIKSTAHKNIVLRVAHGEIYYREKLCRFGLAPDPFCPRCGEIETLRHKFIECDYVAKIWDVAFRVSKEVCTIDPINEDRTIAALGAYLNSNNAILTLNAELLQRINSLPQTQDYLLHPKFIIKAAINSILKKERNGQCKEMIKSISELRI